VHLYSPAMTIAYGSLECISVEIGCVTAGVKAAGSKIYGISSRSDGSNKLFLASGWR